MAEFPQKLDLDNPEFQQAYSLLRNTNVNVFLTGKAGTGKSTFLRYICKNLKKKYVVLAPTGVAAVNVGGVTIHSFFQMPLRPVPPDDPEYSVSALKKSKKFSKRKRKLIQELELVIIDEVSMVRPDMIDFIDRALRAITGNRRKPFGGVQLLLVGDIFQLEPVVTNESKPILAKYYPDFFFFNARAYESAKLVSIELNKIYRQTDSKFIDMLDRIRINRATTEDFKILNSRVETSENTLANNNEKFGITLTSRRDSASMINKEKLDELSGNVFIFRGEIKDEFPEKILPTDLELELKKDAQVMLIRNDMDKRWVNGTLAKIHDISDEEIKVELEDGKIEKVEREEWHNINYIFDEKEKKVREEVIGTFTQYPLKAAWALTIHKSQGLTFNNVTIDMAGGAFSAGQTYVALSRCRSLEGLRFINPLRYGDVIVSRGAAEFSRNFNDPDSVEKAMNEAKAAELSCIARKQFENDNFEDAIEALWEINTLTGALAKGSVRRLLVKSLSVIKNLRKDLKKKDRILKDLSKEFTELGEVCMDEEKSESAYRNYQKAYKLDGSNEKARFGMADALVAVGEFKKSKRILNELINAGGEYAYDSNILKGDILMEEEDYASAAIHYQAAFKIKDKCKVPVYRLINVYEIAEMDDLADIYRQLLEEIGDD